VTTNEPDFASLHTAEEWQRHWDSTTDHTDFVRWIMRTGRASGAESTSATKLIAVRLPETVVARLDELSAGNRDGRSGLIREAVGQFLDRLDTRAA
jgi:hypothetical protein